MASNLKGQNVGYFSRVQLIGLGVAFVLSSAVIFVLGVWVGQRLEEHKLLKRQEALVKIPVNPPQGEAPPEPAAKEEMTFYEDLVKEPSPAEQVKAPAAEVSRQQAKPQLNAQTKAGGGPWTVQVNAFPHERDAQRLAKQLKDKGYDAYVVATVISGRSWYRVRVGRLAAREEANRLRDVLQGREKLAHAITVSR